MEDDHRKLTSSSTDDTPDARISGERLEASHPKRYRYNPRRLSHQSASRLRRLRQSPELAQAPTTFFHMINRSLGVSASTNA
jgi:hypothetical protein